MSSTQQEAKTQGESIGTQPETDPSEAPTLSNEEMLQDILFRQGELKYQLQETQRIILCLDIGAEGLDGIQI